MPEDIISLQRSVSHLRNWVLLLTIGWAATVSGWLLLRLPSQVHAAQPQNLRVRRLAVVDENGTERVVIAAPLPEPIIHGVKGTRDSPISGILIYDPKGNERGGYGTSDAKDLSALLTLDSENDQVFTAYANADSGASVWVANEKHQNVVMSTHNTAVLEITRGKNIVYKQPPDAPDLKQ
jgi:hypothetical protein